MSTNALQPAVNRELRAKLIDEALRSPGRYGLKLDRSVRQALRLMRLPGQPLAVELLAVFACLFDVRVLVHFGPDHPMTFCSARHSKRGNIHLHCLAGIHFNLLTETGALDEQNPVLSAYIVNEERARDGSDQGLSRRHSAEAQGKNLQSEAEETRGPACGHLFSSRCSAAAICNGQAACALLDSGAAVSLCSADSLGRLGFRDSDVRRSNVALQGLAGLTFGTEYVEAEVALSPEMKTVRVPLVVERSSSFGHCLLLGVNFLHEAGAIIDVERREVTCGSRVKKAIERPGNLLASKLGPRYAGPLTVTRVNDNGVTYEGSEQETQGTPRPRAEGSPPRQVRFQLPASTEPSDDGLRRSSRTRRPPQWLSDYEM
ncbi:hypothetical protein FJT64_023019 [Amphibalanus amphitrite]|uniref:Peptidase A2 domain-containing protein n=1 Tax=Amphibalanus amphitrite TaxID=1232801 RepID=A0A6A4WTD1_AMPAM|nr:hypothetical protein FJT64_023019 [Amphibalanus amphitrite]